MSGGQSKPLTVFVDQVETAPSGDGSMLRGHVQSSHPFEASWPVELVVSSRIVSRHVAEVISQTANGWIDLHLTPAVDVVPDARCEVRVVQPPAPVVAMQALLLDIVDELSSEMDSAAQAAVDAAPHLSGSWREVVRRRLGLDAPDGDFDTRTKREWAAAGRNPQRSPSAPRWAQATIEQTWVVAPTAPVARWRELHREVLNRVATGKLGQNALYVMFDNYEALTNQHRALIDQELIRAAVDGLSDGDRFDPIALIGHYKIPGGAEPLEELAAQLELEPHPTSAIEAKKVRRIVAELRAHGDQPGPLDIPPGLLGRADRMKGGQLFEIEGAATSMDTVTKDQVRRAWEIGADGQPTGRMQTNRQFMTQMPPGPDSPTA